MEKPLIVYSTFPDAGTAEAVCREIVEARLAACVNVLPGVRSVYSWQGRVESASEAAAIFKSRAGLSRALMTRIRELHPYETPVIVELGVADIDAETLAWLVAETLPDGGSV